MRLGGFVIHASAARDLPRCLDSLGAVCDEVVSVDSGSTDGSADLVRARGLRRVVIPWEGYGAARAAGVEALAGCDWVFFLDSDEWLEPKAVAALRAWKSSPPNAAKAALVRRDWADLPTGRFLFGRDVQVRLARREAARFEPAMIVHEALPRSGAARTGIAFEHRFATSIEGCRAKEERYALLWALQARAAGKRPRAALPRALIHAFRFAILKGAALRGGARGLELAWAMARYHGRKNEVLREIAAGGHGELVAALSERRYGDLFRALPA